VTGRGWRRFGAVDVHYQPQGGACAALVVAGDERFSRITAEHTMRVDTVAAYLPGQFYLRELPAIEVVLATTDPMDLLVIDGYVTLDPHGRPGLGAHLHTDTGVAVIGVAKTAFATATHATAVRRGAATRPLYVTAAGLDPHRAAGIVTAMAGPYRLPDALRRVDALARRCQPTGR
jgi:deoxyribonuclease V